MAKPDENGNATRLREAIEALEAVVRDRGLLGDLSLEDRHRLLAAAGDVFNPDVVQRRQWGKALRKREKAAKQERDERVLAETGIRVLREKPVFTTPNVFAPDDFVQREVDDAERREVIDQQHCYVCKQRYVEIHPFYDQLCLACGDFNYAKRTESADLTGRVALLTGGRVKIGYQAGIKLLRAGAALIVTTRFPRDAAARYAQEADFDDWGDRLEIFGLDLRHTPSVEEFCRHLNETRDRLDFIVNNACQTVRRPPDFYRHMMELETAAEHTMPAAVRGLIGAYERTARSTRERWRALLPRQLSQVPLLPEDSSRAASSSPRGGSTRICSRSISATATRGGSCWPRSRRSSSSRRSS